MPPLCITTPCPSPHLTCPATADLWLIHLCLTPGSSSPDLPTQGSWYPTLADLWLHLTSNKKSQIHSNVLHHFSVSTSLRHPLLHSDILPVLLYWWFCQPKDHWWCLCLYFPSHLKEKISTSTWKKASTLQTKVIAIQENLTCNFMVQDKYEVLQMVMMSPEKFVLNNGLQRF